MGPFNFLDLFSSCMFLSLFSLLDLFVLFDLLDLLNGIKQSGLWPARALNLLDFLEFS